MNYQELFNFMYNEHGIILIQSEMDDIIKIVDNMKNKSYESNNSNSNNKPRASNQGRV